MLQRLAEIYRGGDWGLLIAFHGIIIALIVFVCLQLIALRGRRLALKALEAIQKLVQEIATVETRLDQLEQQLKDSLDAHAGEVEGRVSERVDQEFHQMRLRLDAIESAVRGLRVPAGPLPAAAVEDAALAELVSEEEAEFEEWEREAKELAEGEEGEAAPRSGAAASREPQTEYPAEMGRTEAGAAEEAVEDDLFTDDLGLPEVEDEEDSGEQ